MLWVFLAVVWLQSGDVQSSSAVFTSQAECQEFGKSFAGTVQQIGAQHGVVAAFGECVTVTDPTAPHKDA